MKLIRLLLPVGFGLCGAALLLSTFARTANAASNLFVISGGLGSICTQSSPCALQTAVAQANNGDTIYVASGLYTGTGSAVIPLTKTITLYGGWDGLVGPVVRNPNANPSILDGEDQRRVIAITGALTATIAPTIDGFTILRGNAVGLPDLFSSWPGGAGAGIYGENANPIITNNVITHNTILTSSVSAGAGIYLYNASASSRIQGNTIISNTTSNACNGYGALTLDQSSIVVQGNSVSQNKVCGVGSLTIYYGAPTIRNNIVQGNGPGGGIFVLSSSALIQSNQVLSNTGAGIHLYETPATVDANVIAYNTSDIGAGILSENEDTVPSRSRPQTAWARSRPHTP